MVLRRTSTCELPSLSLHTFLNPFSGPVISPAAKDRILGLIGSAEQEGGKIHLDGRHVQVSGYEHGNFIGPTIIEANTSMKCYEWVAFCIHRLEYEDSALVKKYLDLSSLLSRQTR